MLTEQQQTLKHFWYRPHTVQYPKSFCFKGRSHLIYLLFSGLSMNIMVCYTTTTYLNELYMYTSSCLVYTIYTALSFLLHHHLCYTSIVMYIAYFSLCTEGHMTNNSKNTKPELSLIFIFCDSEFSTVGCLHHCDHPLGTNKMISLWNIKLSMLCIIHPPSIPM